MKKTPPAPAPSRSSWRLFALLSLGLNVVLLAWVLATAGRRDRAPVESADPALELSSSVAPAQPRVRASGPYAALGSFMAENNRIPDLGWTEEQFTEFLAGFRSSYEGRGVPIDDDAKRLRDEINERVQKMIAAEQPDPAEEYFRILREKESVQRTASGLHYRITEDGFGGPTPTADDTVVLSFAARLPDGRELPNFSRARVKMPVRDLLPGLAEGVQLLRVGGKSLVYLPPDLAFKPESWPADIPQGLPLAFFVELHEIVPEKDR